VIEKGLMVWIYIEEEGKIYIEEEVKRVEVMVSNDKGL